MPNSKKLYNKMVSTEYQIIFWRNLDGSKNEFLKSRKNILFTLFFPLNLYLEMSQFSLQFKAIIGLNNIIE